MIIDISMSHHFLPQIMFVLLDCAVVQSWVLQDHILPRVAILSEGRSHIIRLGFQPPLTEDDTPSLDIHFKTTGSVRLCWRPTVAVSDVVI